VPDLPTRAHLHAELPPERLARWAGFAKWDEPYFPRLLGFEVEEIRQDYCRMRLPWRFELTQPAGVVHGGAIASLVDSVVVPAIGSAYDEQVSFVTIDMQIQYRGAVVQEDQVAEGWVTNRGRSIVFCEAEVLTASGKPVAKGMLTYRLHGPRPG
jgi:uncharacterized protein (TIGR00369 family)